MLRNWTTRMYFLAALAILPVTGLASGPPSVPDSFLPDGCTNILQESDHQALRAKVEHNYRSWMQSLRGEPPLRKLAAMSEVFQRMQKDPAPEMILIFPLMEVDFEAAALDAVETVPRSQALTFAEYQLHPLIAFSALALKYNPPLPTLNLKLPYILRVLFFGSLNHPNLWKDLSVDIEHDNKDQVASFIAAHELGVRLALELVEKRQSELSSLLVKEGEFFRTIQMIEGAAAQAAQSMHGEVPASESEKRLVRGWSQLRRALKL